MEKDKNIEEAKKSILDTADKYFELTQTNNNFVPGISNIPVSGKVLDKEDLRNLILSSLDLWLTAGEFTDKFEDKLRKTLEMRHCLFVNSGSSANLVAMSSLKELYKLKEGDEIITSAVNFPTTMNPIIQNGLKLTTFGTLASLWNCLDNWETSSNLPFSKYSRNFEFHS